MEELLLSDELIFEGPTPWWSARGSWSIADGAGLAVGLVVREDPSTSLRARIRAKLGTNAREEWHVDAVGGQRVLSLVRAPDKSRTNFEGYSGGGSLLGRLLGPAVLASKPVWSLEDGGGRRLGEMRARGRRLNALDIEDADGAHAATLLRSKTQDRLEFAPRVDGGLRTLVVLAPIAVWHFHRRRSMTSAAMGW